jgi:hypothetical protein
MPDFPEPDPAKDMTAASFEHLNFLLQFAEPPNPDEAALRARFAENGIVPGGPRRPDPSLVPGCPGDVDRFAVGAGARTIFDGVQVVLFRDAPSDSRWRSGAVSCRTCWGCWRPPPGSSPPACERRPRVVDPGVKNR